mmetsp:Transcript_12824/g.14722  ORF Transcript_12824/g.14722 Transcript_12824/m.14722 type:complete len:109 (+) Transcript_12824:128-454(+)
MFCPEMCPVGGVHIKQPCVERAAKKLGISYARAVVAWEKQYPKYDGIVVPLDFEQLIIDAASEMYSQQVRDEKEKRLLKVVSRWEKLVRHALARIRVEEKYGQKLNHQ